MQAALEKLLRREDLSAEESAAAMEVIASGKAEAVQTSAFLVLLAAKGETAAEISGLVRVMLAHACKVDLGRHKLLDLVGTGGDGHNTVNISTAAAMVAAACGAKVAKHGNCSVSSRSGSADVLEVLGVPMLDAAQIAPCVENVGIAFMFAPKFHPAMKHVVPVRKALGVRTVFNILGPLLNPARAQRLMLGVFKPELLQVYGETLLALGVEHALVVHCCGLDELSAVGPAQAVEVKSGAVTPLEIDPAAMGIARCKIEDLRGGDAEFNGRVIRKLLAGDVGEHGALADTVALNAGAGLYVCGLSPSVAAGYRKARDAISAGTALPVLQRWSEEATRLAAIPDAAKPPEAKVAKTA